MNDSKTEVEKFLDQMNRSDDGTKRYCAELKVEFQQKLEELDRVKSVRDFNNRKIARMEAELSAFERYYQDYGGKLLDLYQP